MDIILVGLIAAGGAAVINRYLIAIIGSGMIIYLVPIVEEISKSLLAYFWQVKLPLVHVVFGTVEAIYDFYFGEGRGVLAGDFGLLSHAIFGYITEVFFWQFNSILLGILVAIVLHILWNYIILVKLGGATQ